jgi:hypothetical protein
MKPIWYFVGILLLAIGVLSWAQYCRSMSGEVSHRARRSPSANLVGSAHDRGGSVVPPVQEVRGLDGLIHKFFLSPQRRGYRMLRNHCNRGGRERKQAYVTTGGSNVQKATFPLSGSYILCIAVSCFLSVLIFGLLAGTVRSW